EVLLGEDRQVVEVDVVAAGRAVAGQPRGQAVPALADGHAETAAGPAESCGGAGAATAVALAERRQLAVVGQAAHGTEHATLPVAQQGQRVAGLEAEGGVERAVARAPAGAGPGAFGGRLEQQVG